MTTIVLPHTLLAGTPENVAHVQANDEALRDGVNGTLGQDNMGTGAAGLAIGAFHAYRNAALTTGAGPGPMAQIVLDAEVFDVSSWFDLTTGRYTPLLAGYYQFSWAVGGVGAGGTYYTALFKNAVLTLLGSRTGADANTPGASTGSGIVVANGATDYFDLRVYPNSGATTINPAASATYLAGGMLGRS